MDRSGHLGDRILVTGGAGYIGCVLIPRLVQRGYRVRVVDRLLFGPEGLAATGSEVELIEIDLRDIGLEHLDGVDGVINLGGLSNDPMADFAPELNWELNALATEQLGKLCTEAGIERLVFASSCALYDGLGGGAHDETAQVCPRSAYARSKYFAERRLIQLSRDGLVPVILRSGTVFGWSPRMRFDLVVNSFVKDAWLYGRLMLHDGGAMRRPLVDIRDAADAMIAAYEAPAEIVCGEVYNVLVGNYAIRDVAAVVARAVEAAGRAVGFEMVGAPAIVRDYVCANDKLPLATGVRAARSLAEAVDELLTNVRSSDRDFLTDARHCNIRWFEAHGLTGGRAPTDTATAV